MVKKTSLTKNLGMLLLSIWLILSGLLQLDIFSLPGFGTIMGFLAIASGVLLLINR